MFSVDLYGISYELLYKYNILVVLYVRRKDEGLY